MHIFLFIYSSIFQVGESGLLAVSTWTNLAGAREDQQENAHVTSSKLLAIFVKVGFFLYQNQSLFSQSVRPSVCPSFCPSHQQDPCISILHTFPLLHLRPQLKMPVIYYNSQTNAYITYACFLCICLYVHICKYICNIFLYL